MQDIELEELEVQLYNQIFHSAPNASDQKPPETVSNSIPNSQENNSDLSITREVSNYCVNNVAQKNKHRYWTETNKPINIVKHIINNLVPEISKECGNKTESLVTDLSNKEGGTSIEKTVTSIEQTGPIEQSVVPVTETERKLPPLEEIIPLENTICENTVNQTIENQFKLYSKKEEKLEKSKNRKKRNKNKKKKINPFQNFHIETKKITSNLMNNRNQPCVNCNVKPCICNNQSTKCNLQSCTNSLLEIFNNSSNRPITIGLSPNISFQNNENICLQTDKNSLVEKPNDSLPSTDLIKTENTTPKLEKDVIYLVSDSDDSDDNSVQIISEKPHPVIVIEDSDSEHENITENETVKNPFASENESTIENLDLNNSIEIIDNLTPDENHSVIIEESPKKAAENKVHKSDEPVVLTEAERFEMLQTPDSSVNDFIDNEITVDKQFNFNLHGSDLDLTEKDFVPSDMKKIPNDVYETESSCSGAGTPTKATYDELNNTPMKDIFQEPDLVSFSNFITPNRDKGVKRKITEELKLVESKALQLLKVDETKNNDSNEIKKNKKKDKKHKTKTDGIEDSQKNNSENMKEILEQEDKEIMTDVLNVEKETPNRDKGMKRKSTEELKQVETKALQLLKVDETKNNDSNEIKNGKKKDKKYKSKQDEIEEDQKNDSENMKEVVEQKDEEIMTDVLNFEKETNDVLNKITLVEEQSGNKTVYNKTDADYFFSNFFYEKRKKSFEKQFEKKKKLLLKKKYTMDEKTYNKHLEKMTIHYKKRVRRFESKFKRSLKNRQHIEYIHFNSNHNNSFKGSTINLDKSPIALNEDTIIDNQNMIETTDIKDRTMDKIEKFTPVILIDDSNPEFNVTLNISNEEKNYHDNLNDIPSTSKDTGSPNLKKRFKDFWTPDMKSFYDKSWGEEYFNLDQVMKSMTTDSNKWKIIDEDRYSINSRRKFCLACKKTGHYKYECPLLHKKNIKCSTCGQQGHFHVRCPNLMCTSCGHKGGYFTTSCNRCAHYSKIQCNICKMMGHPTHICPDLWRRYHLTTSKNMTSPDTSRLKPTKEQWCSGCAERGHLYHNCSRVTGNHFPTLPNIISYEPLYSEKPIPPLLPTPSNNPTAEVKIPFFNNMSLDNLTKYKHTIIDNNSKKYLFTIRSLIRTCQRRPEARHLLHQVKSMERDVLENRFNSKKIGIMYKLKSTILKLCY